ncbi:hypothetical protein J437_LFUL001762, partial [Ladona fulva]
MKDYETQLTHYKKENFNLKLRIYFLEERFGPYRGGNEKEDPHQKNIELKVQNETLRKELLENQQLLRDADKAMDQMEKEHQEEIQKLTRKQKVEIERLESQMEEMKKDFDARLEKPNHEDSAAMYAFAFGMPELMKNSNSNGKELEEKLLQKIAELENQKSELENHLSNKDEDCNRLEIELSNVQELSERDKMLEETNNKLEEKEKVLVEIQITLDEKQRQIEALRASLSSKDEALAQLRSKLAESESVTRDLQNKIKSQFGVGNSHSKYMMQLENNITKRRFSSYKNHARGQRDIPNGEVSRLPERPGTAPPIAKTIEIEDGVLKKLQEEVETWKKKVGEMQKEKEHWEILSKTWGNEEAKLKRCLQGMKKHYKEIEKELDRYKQDTKQKEKKIRDLIFELTVAQDQVNRAKWEEVGGGGGRHHGIGFSSGLDDVSDMADEENERLWAELENKEKKLKQITEEKNALSSEMDKKIQSVMASLKEKEDALAGYEQKYNSAAAQLVEKNRQIQTLEEQLVTAGASNSVERRVSCKESSISESVTRKLDQSSKSLKEILSVQMNSSSEHHSILHSYIEKFQRNLRNTPEREGGPRNALEEAERSRHDAEEICALLGGHVWELAAFLEGLLEESNLSLSESHKSSIRRALEWSRELSLSVLSTTGLVDDGEQNCTRTSLAILRDFPSFNACVEAANSHPSERKNSSAVECSDGLFPQTIVISEVESPKPEEEPLEVEKVDHSVESLHPVVEILHARENELEKGKTIDLREGSSEIGRGGNSGESVRTVRNARPTHLNLTPACETVRMVEQKVGGHGNGAPLTCTPAGVVVSPSESEAWSEPDRTVSLARIGLENIARATPSAAVALAAQQSTPESGGSSLVETRTPSKRGHGEIRRLQSHIRGLEQLIKTLTTEMRVYHGMGPAARTPSNNNQSGILQNNVNSETTSVDQEAPCMRDAEVNTTVGVQSEAVDSGGAGHILDEVRCLRDKLEFSLKHNELLGRQLEGVLSGLQSHQVEDGMADLCFKLKEATERLEEEQDKGCDLQHQLASAKNSIIELERELEESKTVEMKLRTMLKEKEEEIKEILESKEISIKNTTSHSGHVKEDESFEKAFTTGGDKDETSSEMMQSLMKQNISLNDREKTTKGVISKGSSSEISDGVFRNIGTISDSSFCKTRLIDWHSQENGVALEDRHEIFSNQLGGNLKELEASEKYIGSNETLSKVRRSLNQEIKQSRLLELENDVLHLQTALKDAQDHALAEESRAKKAEEEAEHWMKLAQEYEKLRNIPGSVGIKTVEDPSECSSSSVLSGIIPDLNRQRSEMSDYVSDQTGGEDSEPSLSQMSHKNKSGRPGIIPLEMSHAMAYLSPSADTSPTARHDAFSSPDLGIESDPGRFSSLENQHPKSPVGIALHNESFEEVLSSENTIVYSNSYTTVNRSLRTRTPGTHNVKEVDDLISASYVKGLMLENDRLKQCLAEKQKSLDETLCKLEAANR